MFTSRWVPGWLAVIMATWGLADAGLPNVASAQEIFPRIINGTPTVEYPAVGIVGSQSRGGFCSGTLISPLHVLTAAHGAEVIETPTAGTFELNGQVYTTWDITIHPDYNPFTLSNDIAILELEDPVLDVEPMEIFRGIPSAGDQLILVGYGGGGNAEQGGDGTFGVKRVGVTTIEQVTATLIRWTFDDPLEANTAPGDSGGPGFLEVLGIPQIAAITSGGTEPDAGLGDRSFSTRVDAYANWIDGIVLVDDGEEPGDGDPGDGPDGDEDDGSGDPVDPGQDPDEEPGEGEDADWPRPPCKPILSWRPGWMLHPGFFLQWHRPGFAGLRPAASHRFGRPPALRPTGRPARGVRSDDHHGLPASGLTSPASRGTSRQAAMQRAPSRLTTASGSATNDRSGRSTSGSRSEVRVRTTVRLPAAGSR